MSRYLKVALGASVFMACSIIVLGSAPGETPPAGEAPAKRDLEDARRSARGGPRAISNITRRSPHLTPIAAETLPTLYRKDVRTLTSASTCLYDYECDDCNPCTHDDCSHGTCVNALREVCSPCDDGLFCNGAEMCDEEGNCINAHQIFMPFVCIGGPHDGESCSREDSECHVCVSGARDGLTCCPTFGACSQGICIGGSRDGEECCPDGTCDQTGICVPAVEDYDPCLYLSDLICDEEADDDVSTGACVAFCIDDAECDDGLVCNGGEMCMKHPTSEGYPPGHGGQCIGGAEPKAPCSTDAQCGPDGQCGGVCRPDPSSPPPCGEGVPCEEPGVGETEPTCGNGRCCSVDLLDPDEFICCRATQDECLTNGCKVWGGVAPHRFLGVGDLPGTPYDEGSCDVLSIAPPWPWTGESFACPKYSSGLAPAGDYLVDVGPIGHAPCLGLYEVGDDYRLSNAGPDYAFYEVHTIRFYGAFAEDNVSRVRVSFYDTTGRFITDFISEPVRDSSNALRTVIPYEEPIVPAEGWITLQPDVSMTPLGRVHWLSTDAVDVGYNDPGKMWVNGGPVIDYLPDAPDILAFEIVAQKALPPYGACCDLEAGGCTLELPWLCEEEGNVFHGIGTFCSLCSDDPFLSCDSASDCRHCQDGDRDSELCCPDDGECVAGTCSGGSRDTLECCPNGACDTSPFCYSVPPWCQLSACCDASTAACTQVMGGFCDGDELRPCYGAGDCAVDEACLAPCPQGTASRGFGTNCDPNCCEQAVQTGGDNCLAAYVHQISVPAINEPPITVTITGDNSSATYDDYPDLCNLRSFDPAREYADPGWWEAFEIDDCAMVSVDFCCTDPSHRPQYGFVVEGCPCGRIHSQVVPEDVCPWCFGGEGPPSCTGLNESYLFGPLSPGRYFVPVYSAPTGHIGGYQMHITVTACPQAACCLQSATCIGGPLDGQGCGTNDDCAPVPGDEVCVGDDNRPSELCCPDGGACDHDPDDPKCVDGSRDGLPCCDGGGLCKGNCVSDCAVLSRTACEAVDGYWLGAGYLEPKYEVTTCDADTCVYGSCCLGLGDCLDWAVIGPCDPLTGLYCIDRKDCDGMGGDFVGGARCDYPKAPCPSCEFGGEGNCQMCNGSDYLTLLSDLTAEPYGVVHADDFVPYANRIDTICVWGTYFDGYNPGQHHYQCPDTVEDNFRVRIYDDDNGLPGDLVAERSNIIEVPKSFVPDCPNWGYYYDHLPLEVFTLSFPTITLPSVGETYWLEVANKTDVLVGGTKDPDNTCYWHWMQVLWGGSSDPLAGNRHAAVGTDDRCMGGYYDGYACAARCIGYGTWCDHDANICVGGDNDGRPCCPGGTCKAGLGGGYTDLSARWSGTAFCLSGPDGPVDFDPSDPPTGACCDCDGVCVNGLTQADCADVSPRPERQWTAGAACGDTGVCDPPVIDNCGSAPDPPCGDPLWPVWHPDALVTDGLYGFDTSCATTDGPCCPTGHESNQLGRDLWYCYTATCTGELVASMCASSGYYGGIDGYMTVHHDFDNPTECPCPGGGFVFQVGEFDENCTGFGGSGLFEGQIVFPGEKWLIRVGGWGLTEDTTDGGRGLLEVACKATPCYPSNPPNLEVLNMQFTTPINRKNRFISVSVQDAGRQQAIRVVVGAKDAGRGNIPPPFEIWKGQEFYAGEPRPYCENAGTGSSVRPDEAPGCGQAPGVYENGQVWFWAAPLVCDPAAAHFTDWTTLADYCNTPGDPAYDAHRCEADFDCGGGTCGVSDVVHLYHEAIVPSHMTAGQGPIDFEAVYEVSVIDNSCRMDDPLGYSDPVQLHQAGWGDVNENVAYVPNGPPNESVGVVSDVVGLLNKFSNLLGAMQKTRTDLVPCDVDFNIGIPDVVATLSAFTGADYEDTCGSGQCGCWNPPSCTFGLCKGGADHGQICTGDDDCNSDPCE